MTTVDTVSELTRDMLSGDLNDLGQSQIEGRLARLNALERITGISHGNATSFSNRVEAAVTAIAALQDLADSGFDDQGAAENAPGGAGGPHILAQQKALKSLEQLQATLGIETGRYGRAPQDILSDLRSKRLVLDAAAISTLGFSNIPESPEIPEGVLRAAASSPVRCLVMLDDGRSLQEYARAQSGYSNWEVTIDRSALQHPSDFAIRSHSNLEWAVVPIEIPETPATLGLTKADAVETMRHHSVREDLRLPDARLLAKALRLYESYHHEKLFRGVYSFTNYANIVVGGSDRWSFKVLEQSNRQADLHVDSIGDKNVGLAPTPSC